MHGAGRIKSPESRMVHRFYFWVNETIAFRISSTHGVPWSTRSNQSIGLTNWPLTSIWSFSQIWGGANGARPRVRQARMIISQDIFEINSIASPPAKSEVIRLHTREGATLLSC